MRRVPEITDLLRCPGGCTPGAPRVEDGRTPVTPEITDEEDIMRVEVDPGICEGHGECNAVAPDVYDLDDGGYCVIRHSEVPPDLESPASEGAMACPVHAIKVIH
ncbi:MAG TPA: ferredoxin [Pseudonocardiaceae bacterium]